MQNLAWLVGECAIRRIPTEIAPRRIGAEEVRIKSVKRVGLVLLLGFGRCGDLRARQRSQYCAGFLGGVTERERGEETDLGLLRRRVRRCRRIVYEYA